MTWIFIPASRVVQTRLCRYRNSRRLPAPSCRLPESLHSQMLQPFCCRKNKLLLLTHNVGEMIGKGKLLVTNRHAACAVSTGRLPLPASLSVFSSAVSMSPSVQRVGFLFHNNLYGRCWPSLILTRNLHRLLTAQTTACS